MGEIISSAFKDALPLLRSRQRVYVVMAILCAIGGLLLPFLPSVPATTTSVSGVTTGTTMSGASFGFSIPEMFGALAAFWIFPAVVRTANPSFRMSVGVFFTLLGLGIVVALASGIAGMAFLIPGIWVGVKLSQTIWAYATTDGPVPFDRPLKDSWNVTTGQFWETFLFLILVSIVVTIALCIAFGIPAAIAAMVPWLGVVLLPVAFLGFVWGAHVQSLAQLRWFLQLRARHAATAGVPVISGGALA
ncbi:MAG: hypothetical protein GIW95_07560 [Candidatus Eremiobacteraeota bacterium]|nr:hypothetical protein [Candidatus Eremiobacteraeota bacterium]